MTELTETIRELFIDNAAASIVAILTFGVSVLLLRILASFAIGSVVLPAWDRQISKKRVALKGPTVHDLAESYAGHAHEIDRELARLEVMLDRLRNNKEVPDLRLDPVATMTLALLFSERRRMVVDQMTSRCRPMLVDYYRASQADADRSVRDAGEMFALLASSSTPTSRLRVDAVKTD